MTDKIRKIFEQNIHLMGNTDKAILYFREQQYDKALSLVANFMDEVKAVVEAIINDREYFEMVSTESVLEMLSGILKAKKNNDYILFADFLQLQLFSFLSRIQELIITKEKLIFDEERYQDNVLMLLHKGEGFPEDLKEPIDSEKLIETGYRVEYTSCGLMTLAAENEGVHFYFHTNGRVQSEAFILARHWFKKDKKRYIIYGFGMGYHIIELMRLAPKAAIEVYEGDSNIMQLACAFSDLKEIFKDNLVTLIYDPKLKLLEKRIEAINHEEEFLIHYPSLQNIRDHAAKKLLERAIPWSKIIENR
jgi:hypothetical protein